MKLGPLRKITRQITQPSSRLESISVMLECGHQTHSQATHTRARCPSCKQSARLKSARRRLGQVSARRAVAKEEAPIFVTVDAKVAGKYKPEGYRALRIVVYDETPDAERLDRKPKHAMESLKVACHANALTYVRAQLLEMGAKLDGAVIVT